eukprot:TRINITY_DN6679_c0_g1_i1.p1 TRINITY_DN6679_c0_g1~~TRINITY_DN6679_c0_g1_i1.p1  ORF type:complete len:418 (+),score=127.94 TRINITY_DN6679_c0_g1_i1:97-1350(+)
MSSLPHSLNLFGYKLLSDRFNEPNPFLSSFSIAQSFAFILNGASEQNSEEIRRIFLLEKYSLTDINKLFFHLNEVLFPSNQVLELKVANSLWVDKDYSIDPKFLEISNEYKSKVGPLRNVEEINKWTSNSTNGHIPKILDELPKLAKLVLLNAIFFKGKFEQAFPKDKTQPQNFFGLTNKKVPTMFSSCKRPYFENEILQAVRLPYKSPKDLKFEAVILCPLNDGVSTVEDVLDFLKTEEDIKYNVLNLKLYLPKLNIKFEEEMLDYFQKEGMKSAFQIGGFPHLTQPPDLVITKIVHKTMLDLDEEGTTAAAVTMIVGGRGGRSAAPPTPIMRVDRPFILVIREVNSGVNLFCGVINELEGRTITEINVPDRTPTVQKKKKQRNQEKKEEILDLHYNPVRPIDENLPSSTHIKFDE